MHPLARIVAGLLTVFLINRFLWPGTLLHGAIGVITAVAVVGLLGSRGKAPS
jgi:uncharacterized membrane protein